jgi:hypothetical protein
METDSPDLKQARHDLKGRINALKLCISAFEVLESPQEELEFLDLIEQAAERTTLALDQFVSLSDQDQ